MAHYKVAPYVELVEGMPFNAGAMALKLAPRERAESAVSTDG